MTLRASFLLSLNTCIVSGLALSLSLGIHTSACADTTPPSLPEITVTANALCPAGQYHVGSSLGDCIDLGTILGGGGGAGVSYGGNNGQGPVGFNILQLLPQTDCAIKHYSAVQPRGPVQRVAAYAYKDRASGAYHFYPQPLASVPSGWDPVFGITQLTGSQPSSYVFERPQFWMSYPYRFFYTDPYTNTNAYIDPPISVFETSLLITIHEIAHQNGYADERAANGPAALALKEYRSDQNGAHCK